MCRFISRQRDDLNAGGNPGLDHPNDETCRWARSARPGPRIDTELEYGAELLCGFTHVLQRRDGFWPCSCFQATVGIDPELSGRENIERKLEELAHFCDIR